MKERVINKTIIFIFIFLFINQSFAYLINPDAIKIFGLAIDDIVLLFDIAFGGYLIVKTLKLKRPKYLYKNVIIWLLLICFIGAISAQINFGQPFFTGFRSHRIIIASMFLYFPVLKLIYNGILKKDDIIKAIELYIAFILVLYFTQFLMSKFGVYFLNVHIGSRYGNDRFYFDTLLLDFVYIYELDKLLCKKGKITKPIVLCAGILAEILIVQNYRLTFIGLSAVTVLGALLSKVGKYTKMFFITILFILGMMFLCVTSTGRDLLKSVVGKNESSTMIIRHEARKYYLNSINNNLVFGMGYPNNSAYEKAKEVSGFYNGYYLADNGIFGFMFMYGIFGFCWFAYFIFILFKNGLSLYKNNLCMAYLLFTIFILVICINEIHWYWATGPFVMSLVFVLSNVEISSLKGDKNGKKIN